LLEIRERAHFTACFSLPTLDEKVWRETEPRSPHPRKRLEALAELNRAGIPTGILIAPLLPGINDSPEQVNRIVELADEAGAVSIGGQALFLRGETREVFMGWLKHRRPDLVDRYEKLYAGRAYLRGAEKAEIERALPKGRRRKSAPSAARFERDLSAAEAATGALRVSRGGARGTAKETVENPLLQESLF
jgi:DNA repair photolyase